MAEQNIQKYKDPSLAAILSFIISGSGQIYNGDILKGIMLFISACILGVFFLPLALIPAIYGCFDAHSSATKINAAIVKSERGDEEYINSSKFIDKLKKLSSLLKSGIITQEEFSNRKNEMIAEVLSKKLKEDPLEFLELLVPLKQNGVLSDEDISSLKTIE